MIELERVSDDDKPPRRSERATKSNPKYSEVQWKTSTRPGQTWATKAWL